MCSLSPTLLPAREWGMGALGGTGVLWIPLYQGMRLRPLSTPRDSVA